MPTRTTAALGAAMILILGTGVVLASHQYPDVPDSHTFHSDIGWVTDHNIATGYPNGNFGPEDPVSRGQMAAFLHRYNIEFPAAATPESAIVTVFVDRGSGPSRWALYSDELGSPAGTTTGGVFRFSCSAAQAPCKISYGAAVVSDQSSANAVVHPRLLIHKDLGDITFCENADGANNNAGLATISRVATLAAAVTEMQTALPMGIGGSLDCGTAQPYTGTVTEIWVPEGFYDVWATFAFGLTLELPPGS